MIELKNTVFRVDILLLGKELQRDPIRVIQRILVGLSHRMCQYGSRLPDQHQTVLDEETHIHDGLGFLVGYAGFFRVEDNNAVLLPWGEQQAPNSTEKTDG